jgi:hypothetical protein
MYYANNSLFVTGLIDSTASSNGAYQFGSLTAGAAPGSGSLLENSANSVAMAFTNPNENAIFYIATSGSLVCYTPAPAGGWTSATISVPDGQSISSLAWSANTANITAAGQSKIAFPEGCLFIGTFTTSTGEGNSSNSYLGSIYTYDPSPPSTAPAIWQENCTFGTPYSLLADENLNLFVQSGWSGLTLYSFTTEPATNGLIANSDATEAAIETAVWKATQNLLFKMTQQVTQQVINLVADDV